MFGGEFTDFIAVAQIDVVDLVFGGQGGELVRFYLVIF